MYFVRKILTYLPTTSPAPTLQWGHVYDKGSAKTLNGGEGLRMYHCAQQGRAYATHAAVLEQLRGIIKAAVEIGVFSNSNLRRR